MTPLYVAALYGHAPVISILLENNSVKLNKHCLGYCPLHIAVKKGHEAAVKELLKKVPVDSRDHWQRTPLHLGGKV